MRSVDLAAFARDQRTQLRALERSVVRRARRREMKLHAIVVTLEVAREDRHAPTRPRRTRGGLAPPPLHAQRQAHALAAELRDPRSAPRAPADAQHDVARGAAR